MGGDRLTAYAMGPPDRFMIKLILFCFYVKGLNSFHSSYILPGDRGQKTKESMKVTK